MPRRSLACHESLELRVSPDGAADEVEHDRDPSPANATPSPIHSRGKVSEDGGDHERRHRAQEFDDRGYSLEIGSRQRETRREQRRSDCGAEADAGEP
jgi:hypothetical protein